MTLLHIITDPECALAREIVALQEQRPDRSVKVFNLTEPTPDYHALLEEIFAADSVAVW